MPDICRAILFCFGLLWPQAVLANSGIVRGGEHAAFTRVTISSSAPLREIALKDLERDRIGLNVVPAFSELDQSRLFDRITTDRVKAVLRTETGIEVQLNCDCEASAVLESSGLIVIDIRDGSVRKSSPLPRFPVTSGGFPSADIASRPYNALFALDFSVVERINKTIASQIGQTAHISGFSTIVDTRPASAPPTRTDTAQGDTAPSFDQNVDRCHWSEKVWAFITGNNAGQMDVVDPSADQSDLPDPGQPVAGAEDWTVRFLSDGRLEEARLAFSLTSPDPRQQARYQAFEALLAGTARGGSFRFGDCNPLDDVLIATLSQGADIPNSTKIELMNTFAALPVGLQILLFPNLIEPFSHPTDALFPDLAKHHGAELALSKRIFDDAYNIAPAFDPDMQAALTIEMRGTDLEEQSWQTGFASYLEHKRYFDALDALTSDPPLSERKHAHATTELAQHVALHADSVTFLEFALGVLPLLDPTPSDAALAQVANRLIEEGFTASSTQIGRSTTGLEATVDGQSAAATATEPENTSNNQPGPSADAETPVSVSLARQQVENAKALRQSLTDALSR